MEFEGNIYNIKDYFEQNKIANSQITNTNSIKDQTDTE